MKVRASRFWLPVMAVTLLTACNDDNPMGNGNGNPPPDISGTYTLVSFSQQGITLTPPAVSGTFTVDETSNNDDEASGTLDLDITVPDGMGGSNNIVGTGTYTIRSDGTWEQDLPGQQALGTYALVGNTLTVTVTEPAQAASISVWQR
jgi:hypothetical protein